jgi:hypothetical protein
MRRLGGADRGRAGSAGAAGCFLRLLVAAGVLWIGRWMTLMLAAYLERRRPK